MKGAHIAAQDSRLCESGNVAKYLLKVAGRDLYEMGKFPKADEIILSRRLAGVIGKRSFVTGGCDCAREVRPFFASRARMVASPSPELASPLLDPGIEHTAGR